MKRILTFLLAAFLVQTAAAQDAVYDKNTDTSGDRKTIRLKKYSFDDPQPGKISAIEVLPVMWDTGMKEDMRASKPMPISLPMVNNTRW